jgi:hypothetical protein
MSRGIKRKLSKVSMRLMKEISDMSNGGKYAAGLASEGYLGGYWAAISDVMLALEGVQPNRRFWDDDMWDDKAVANALRPTPSASGK